MTITPYIFFNGEARNAMAFYGEVLGAQTLMQMKMGDAPPEMQVPKERADWVMHCTMQIGDSQLMLSDDFMGNSPAMEGCSVQLTYATATEAKAKFEALSNGGEVRMPWVATFWSAGFGTLTDKFGIRWMVGCDEAPSA